MVFVVIGFPVAGSKKELYVIAKLISLSNVTDEEIKPSCGLFSLSTEAGGDKVCQLPISSPIQSEFKISDDAKSNV